MITSKLSLNTVGLNFHHVGLAVSDPKPARQFLDVMGYRFSKEIFDPLQSVKLVFCRHEGLPAMELVYASSSKNPLAPVLDGVDQSFYHICYSTMNLRKSLKALNIKKVRVICVSPPKPAVLFGGKMVSFYFIKGFGLIEILENRDE